MWLRYDVVCKLGYYCQTFPVDECTYCITFRFKAEGYTEGILIHRRCLALIFRLVIYFRCYLRNQCSPFLPLRNYGFKFIIQADFEVPSSREDMIKIVHGISIFYNNFQNLLLMRFMLSR